MDNGFLKKCEVFLKAKKKKQKRYNRYMYGILLFLMVGYTFFFSTKLWYVDKSDLLAATSLDAIQTWEGRDLQLISWDYSEAQNEMQLQISINNKSYDDINTYKVVALESESGVLNTETIIAKEDLYVVNITNVPRKWKQILLKFSFEDGKSFCKFTTNKFDISKVDNIENHTYEEYMVARFESLVDYYEKQIETINKDITKQNTTIENCNSDIEKYKAEEEFQTELEQKDTEKLIATANTKISSAQSKIIEDNEDIQEYSKRIELAKKQMDLYR